MGYVMHIKKQKDCTPFKPSVQFLIFLIIILSNLNAFGQSKNLKLSLYFESDVFILSSDAKKTTDDAIDTLVKENLIKINIVGNTDDSADSLYNMKLSNNRTEQVKNYLIEKGIKPEIIKTSFFGENKPIANNNLEEGKQKNRRVDIFILYEKKTRIPETESMESELIQEEIIKKDDCRSDTVIQLPEGTQLVFNLCEFLEIKDCIEYTETNNSDAILLNGLTLMDSSGYPIASCGMLRISLKPSCIDRDCFKIPVKVRFPVPTNTECDFCGRNARVWDLTNNGSWLQGKGKKNDVKIIKVQGQKFYQFEIYCPNYWKNCDCKLPKGKKVKFKTKRKYRIINVTVTSDCPVSVIEFRSKKRKNIAKKKVPCLIGYKSVVATIINENGDTLSLSKMPLNDLTKRTFFSRCKKIKGENIGHRLGVFPIFKRAFYRKYIIKPSDLL